MKKKLCVMQKMFYLVLMFAISAMLYTGCMDRNMVVDPTSGVTDESILVKSPLGDFLPLDSAAKNQSVFFMYNTSLQNVKYCRWSWGDGAVDTMINTKLSLHKYIAVGMYNINLKAYDSLWNLLSNIDKPFRIVDSWQYGLKAQFKKIQTVNIGGGRWKTTYGVLRQAIQCVPANQPFIVFSRVSGWNPINLNIADSTSDGYYQYTDTVDNNAIEKFSYGGNFPSACYAWLGPTNWWTSEYFVSSEAKICVKWIDGEPYPITTLTALPGSIGDIGTAPVMRLGLNQAGDTLLIYFNKNRVAGNILSPFWVNSLNGILNPLSMSNAPGFTDWWVVKVARINIPANYNMQAKYGDSYNGPNNTNWAAMQGSTFYNAQLGVLDFNANQLGGKVKIKDPSGREYSL